MNKDKSVLETLHFHKQKKDYFLSLPISDQSHVLLNVSKSIQRELLNSIHESELVGILNHLDPDEIVDLLQLLSSRKQTKIKTKFSKQLQEKIEFLHSFAPDSVAGVMNLNYIEIVKGTKKREILERIKEHKDKGQKDPTILIIDNDDNLVGELQLSSLILETDKTLYATIKEIPTLSAKETQEELLRQFKRHKSEKIVVLDEQGLIIGLVDSKEVLRVTEQEQEEDFYGFAGLNKEEEITASAFQKIKFRLGWLITNLFAVFLAALVISYFEETISKYVLLAAFMPIVADMGGNVGTQTTAVFIRSLALHKVGPSVSKILFSESFAALINGLVIGVIVAIFALILGETLFFGLIAMIAIVINLIATSSLGVLIPLGLKKLGYDPASASTLYITTIGDILGFVVFLGLATIFLI